MVTTLVTTRTVSIETLEKAIGYLRHEIDLRALHEWMGCHTTWLMTAPRDVGTEVAGLMELGLAEIEAGHATADDLRQEIRDFLVSSTVVAPGRTLRFDLGTPYQAFSSSVTVEAPVAPSWEGDRPLSADTRCVGASW